MVTHHVQNSEFEPVEGEMRVEIDALKAQVHHWFEHDGLRGADPHLQRQIKSPCLVPFKLQRTSLIFSKKK